MISSSFFRRSVSEYSGFTISRKSFDLDTAVLYMADSSVRFARASLYALLISCKVITLLGKRCLISAITSAGSSFSSFSPTIMTAFFSFVSRALKISISSSMVFFSSESSKKIFPNSDGFSFVRASDDVASFMILLPTLECSVM